MSEKIRTPDTLVRSQVLYPAELHSHKNNLTVVAKQLRLNLMPATGIEPVRILLRRILSPVRLPVPPRRQSGQWWIRTTEASCSRFTVCPLWPLGKLPIYLKVSLEADDRTRTDNLLITNQLLCQLSHIGILSCFHKKWDLQGSNL